MQYVDPSGTLRAERRRQPRARMLAPGSAVVNNGWSTFDLTIRNRSQGGVRVELPGPSPLPSRFELRFENRKHWVEIAWRRGLTLGLAFEDSGAEILPFRPRRPTLRD